MKTTEEKKSDLAEAKTDKKVKEIKKKSALKKLDPESAKLLAALKEKVNKKTFGRKVRDSEIIGRALSLLEQQHIKELQEATLSERDRLGMAHEEYVKEHGKITLDEFIGKLLRREIASGA